MKVQWTGKALSDLARLHEFLAPANSYAAARIVQSLSRVPDILARSPRRGERWNEYAPREVWRIISGDYELRYEIAGVRVIVLRIWHTREDR